MLSVSFSTWSAISSTETEDNFMPNQNKGLQDIIKYLADGSEDRQTRTVKVINALKDMNDTTNQTTKLDSKTGRRTHTVQNTGGFLPSGQFLPSLDELEGLCFMCREEGEFKPIYNGNGHACEICGRLMCLEEHGSIGEDGRFLCEECAHIEKIGGIKKTIFGAFKGLFKGEGNG